MYINIIFMEVYALKCIVNFMSKKSDWEARCSLIKTASTAWTSQWRRCIILRDVMAGTFYWFSLRKIHKKL